MKTRPWPIVLLALCHLLAPLPNAVISATLEGVGLWQYLRVFASRLTFFEALSGWLVFPAAAFSIFAMKRWSYAAYLACMGLISFSNILAWSQHPDLISLPFLVALIAADLAVTAYFLLPAVRVGYFDSSVRWWESKPRYLLGLEATLEDAAVPEGVTLVNLSEGGAFVRASRGMSRGERVTLSFRILSSEYRAQGVVVHGTRLPGARPYAHGLQFDLTRSDKQKIVDLVHALELIGVPDTRTGHATFKDFAEWVSGLGAGKGWVPEVKRPGMAPLGPAQAPALAVVQVTGPQPQALLPNQQATVLLLPLLASKGAAADRASGRAEARRAGAASNESAAHKKKKKAGAQPIKRKKAATAAHAKPGKPRAAGKLKAA
jgi:hypothetical protein